VAQDYDPQAPVRIPLAVATNPRSADVAKDALIKNAFIDSSQRSETKYVVKRPGFYVGSEAITTGNNRGIYVNPNNPTGGTPGEVEVWYIPAAGGAYLTSFSVSDEPPPVDVFRNYSANLIIDVSPSPTAGSFLNESTEVILNDFVRFYYYQNGSDPYLAFEWVLGGVPGGAAEIHSTLNGTYFMEVKLEGGNFNLYQDSVLVSTFVDPGFGAWPNPTLSGDIQGTGITFSDLQFIP
jgi:hypothetical protein